MIDPGATRSLRFALAPGCHISRLRRFASQLPLAFIYSTPLSFHKSALLVLFVFFK
jgi:hypothetical protein